MISKSDSLEMWRKYDKLVGELGESMFLDHFKDKVFEEIGFDKFSDIIDNLTSVFISESVSRKEKIVDSILTLLRKS